MMLNRHKFWTRHNPKTKFEHLVDDYRYRLIGQGDNGLNGLFKALRNGHIGLFNRINEEEEHFPSLKILRKIE
ncbi:hypothetical protein Mgra_00003131 [Meloidogyne graminicola]|uniref:Uncharacterized protein n=1 Tax=Meloidogyne graminicola TaxID=189291 RepID=A0A8S9ZVT6_9BILA|nr:hypothetical protein Mgra_00003131 [Meloidogyne graminicola]